MFFLVLQDQRTMQCGMRHDTRKGAEKEAMRLADANPGKCFFVAFVSNYAIAEVQPAKMEELQGMPK
jgi:hypothetical protein